MNRGTLFAVPFDVEKLKTTGSPVPVLQQLSYSAMFGSAKLTFSRTGTFLYRSREIDFSRVSIQWLDADGKTQPLLDKPGLFVYPRISPDAQRLAVVNTDQRSGVWIYDIRRDIMVPLTGERNASRPVWTPDGKYLVYQGSSGISFAQADGGGSSQSLTQNKDLQYPTDFSPDGKRLAFHQMGQQGYDIWILPVERQENGLKAGTPELFTHTSNGERDAKFSPDGHWIAYTSSESGNPQVYVRAFPDRGRHWQVSSNGGTSPIFSRNGKDIFYFDIPGDQIMVASYSVNGGSFIVEKPRAWSRQSVALTLNCAVGAQYDVAPDGKRIAVSTYADSTQQSSGHVIFLQNFFDELQRKVPLGGK